MHILKSCTKQMEMTNSHQTYFWNLKLQRVLQFDYKLFLPQAMFLYRKKTFLTFFGFSCKAT